MADLDKIIARLEVDLDLARIAAEKVKVAAGKDWYKKRGGATKGIYNLLERITGLEILKVSPTTTVLFDVEVWGFDVVVNGASVKRISVTEVNGLGQRFIDLFQKANLHGMGIELKSEATTLRSVKGGLSEKEIKAIFRTKTSIQKQLLKEKKILEFARKNGLKIILKGRDVVTGLFIEFIVDPDNIHATRIVSYRKIPDKILPAPLPPPDPTAPKPKKAKPKAKAPPKAKAKAVVAKPKPLTSTPAQALKPNRQTQGGRPTVADRGTIGGKPARVEVQAAKAPAIERPPVVSAIKKASNAVIEPAVKPPAVKPVVEPPVVVSGAPRPRFKMGPKLKFGAGLLLTLGMDLLFGWLHSKAVKAEIEDLDPDIKKAAKSLFEMESVRNELHKFRSGEDLQHGFALYFKIVLLIHIDYHEHGAAGQSKFADINKIEFKSIEMLRREGKEYFPDTRGEPSEFENRPLVESIFYAPVFELSVGNIDDGISDAADEDFRQINNIQPSHVSSILRNYLQSFEQYAQVFPDRAAAARWNELTSTAAFYMVLIGYGLRNGMDLINLGYDIDYVMQNTSWLNQTLKRKFLQEYYETLDYDAVDKLRFYMTGDRACPTNCHTANDRWLRRF